MVKAFLCEACIAA